MQLDMARVGLLLTSSRHVIPDQSLECVLPVIDYNQQSVTFHVGVPLTDSMLGCNYDHQRDPIISVIAVISIHILASIS